MKWKGARAMIFLLPCRFVCRIQSKPTVTVKSCFLHLKHEYCLLVRYNDAGYIFFTRPVSIPIMVNIPRVFMKTLFDNIRQLFSRVVDRMFARVVVCLLLLIMANWVMSHYPDFSFSADLLRQTSMILFLLSVAQALSGVFAKAVQALADVFKKMASKYLVRQQTVHQLAVPHEQPLHDQSARGQSFTDPGRPASMSFMEYPLGRTWTLVVIVPLVSAFTVLAWLLPLDVVCPALMVTSVCFSLFFPKRKGALDQWTWYDALHAGFWAGLSFSIITTLLRFFVFS